MDDTLHQWLQPRDLDVGLIEFVLAQLVERYDPAVLVVRVPWWWWRCSRHGRLLLHRWLYWPRRWRALLDWRRSYRLNLLVHRCFLYWRLQQTLQYKLPLSELTCMMRFSPTTTTTTRLLQMTNLSPEEYAYAVFILLLLVT